MSSKKKKIRVEFRKNRSKPPRGNDLTRQFGDASGGLEDAPAAERVRARGELSRHRTILSEGEQSMPAAAGGTLAGRVLRVQGLHSFVDVGGGTVLACTLRRVLKSLATDERNIVTTGDLVQVRLSGAGEGVIERVEPRHGVLTRASRRREHVVVANVDQLAIVVSLVEPDLKPHLIDRYLACAIRGGLAPILLLNKVDRIDPAAAQTIVGCYSQLGIRTLLTSPLHGTGMERLRGWLAGRTTVLSGQSGVGKSSLLNAIQPGLQLRVREVSDVNQKGRHTTTTAELIPLDGGGWVVDTPGVRQLQLWDTRPEEVEGYFPEFAPFVAACKFPDCTHTHEAGCGLKSALERRLISEHRYVSYLGMFSGLASERA